MLGALYITASWIVSRKAQHVYFISSLLDLFLSSFLIAALSADHALSRIPPSVDSVLRMLIFLSVIGTATLWVGMWYFWFRFGRERTIGSAIWFVLLLLGIPLGPLLYYWFVYRPFIKSSRGDFSQTASAAS